MNAKTRKYGKMLLKGFGWIAGKVILLALVAMIAAGVNIAMDHGSLIPLNAQWLAYNGVEDFTLKGTSIAWVTDNSIVLKWHNLYFEVQNTWEHDMVLQGTTESAGGWQYYPHPVSDYYGSWYMSGDIPEACFGVEGDLHFSDGLEVFFLNYNLAAEEDGLPSDDTLKTLCYWKEGRD